MWIMKSENGLLEYFGNLVVGLGMVPDKHVRSILDSMETPRIGITCVQDLRECLAVQHPGKLRTPRCG